MIEATRQLLLAGDREAAIESLREATNMGYEMREWIKRLAPKDKIMAIVLLRGVVPSLGLKEAKDTVESWGYR